MAADQVQGAIEVPASLLMNGNPVCACLDEDGDELVGILDHQVAVERQVGDFAQGLHNRWSNGQVGDEMAVHDIDMDHRAATLGGTADLICQMGEVRRQNRRCKVDQTWVSRKEMPWANFNTPEGPDPTTDW